MRRYGTEAVDGYSIMAGWKVALPGRAARVVRRGSARLRQGSRGGEKYPHHRSLVESLAHSASIDVSDVAIRIIWLPRSTALSFARWLDSEHPSSRTVLVDVSSKMMNACRARRFISQDAFATFSQAPWAFQSCEGIFRGLLKSATGTRGKAHAYCKPFDVLFAFRLVFMSLTPFLVICIFTCEVLSIHLQRRSHLSPLPPNPHSGQPAPVIIDGEPFRSSYFLR
jgi:hypothetical protein